MPTISSGSAVKPTSDDITLIRRTSSKDDTSRCPPNVDRVICRHAQRSVPRPIHANVVSTDDIPAPILDGQFSKGITRNHIPRARKGTTDRVCACRIQINANRVSDCD